MKKINFKTLKAKNFFCYGKEGVQVTFSDYGNIVLIKGKNLDVGSEEADEKHSSNGIGKSSIIDALVYGLYGKTVKNPKKLNQKDIIKSLTGKNLEVEVTWDDYRVVRTRKPDSLRLWKSSDQKWDASTEITLGGMPATQNEIENILGLTYEVFVNIGVFTDDNTSSFLECDAAEKRHIVENLLSLEKYRIYSDNAKKLFKEHKDLIKVRERDSLYAEKVVDDTRSAISSLEMSVNIWKQNKQEEIKKLEAAKKLLENQIANLLQNDGALKKYEEAQIQKNELNKKISDIDLLVQKADTKISTLIEEYEEKTKAKNNVEAELNGKKTDLSNSNKQKIALLNNIKKLNSLEVGVKCGHCHSVINTENYADVLKSHNAELETLENATSLLDGEVQSLSQDFESKSKQSYDVDQQIKKLRLAISKLSNDRNNAIKEIENIDKLPKSDAESQVAAYKAKIDAATDQISSKNIELSGASPYDALILEAVSKLGEACTKAQEVKIDVENLYSLNQYFEYWIQAFGDSGIRKYVIDEIVPALNNNINYWMDFLIEGNMRISFDNEFNEIITKGPDFSSDIKYYALSNGQKGRVNLALSQAFAHIMSINSGKNLSFVFLDEVTSNIDVQGVNGIIGMIQELSREKQVFLITHNHDLLDELNGCDTINLVLKNGITALQK